MQPGPRRTRLLPLLVMAIAALSLGACQFPTQFLQSATPTPSPTFTPTPPPTATPLPSPTPVPTLAPQARVEAAEWALFIGDYAAALDIFIQTLEVNPAGEVEAAARLGIGRTQLAQGDSTNALTTLRDLVERFPDSAQAGEARIFIARILTGLGRYEEAAASYGEYMSRFPGVLDAYVLEWQGDVLRAGGFYTEAVNAYTAALNTPRLSGSEDLLQVKIGGTISEAGDTTTALAIYTELSERSTSEALQPTLLLLRGELLERLGQPEEAHVLYHRAITEYPRAYDSYLALLRLIEQGVEVNELQRGIIDYFVGEYSLAVLAFDRYLTAEPEVHDGSGHYYKGLSLRAIDSYDQAIAEWNELIQTHTSADPYWDDAWEAIGDTHWLYLGDYESAISIFESFPARVPDHERAAEFLFFAAQIAERSGQLERAAAFWERVVSEYPTHYQVGRSHFLAGITLYRLGRYQEAYAHFQTILSLTSAPFESSQALFWSGKAQRALGDQAAAGLTFEQAAAVDPTGYYSERAADILGGGVPFAPPEGFDLAVDWEAERTLAEGWLRLNFSLPEDIDLASPGPLAGDIRFVRGTALWNLGFYEQSRAEFESLRLAMTSDPVSNFRLANYLVDLGLYRTAIFCAREVLNLAGLDDAGTLHAPPWFNHIRFGAYYPSLVNPTAIDNDIHPLLVWSVIRQESLFEGFVRSTAGARGLMQIIPSTGAGIYNNLGWPENYTDLDLYRPIVNVTFGVSYLTQQRDYFSGGRVIDPIHIYAALAAYNGGPGNAAVWLSEAQGDPDLFLEIVRFDETRRYIRGIYEIYEIYLGIYERSP